MFYIEYVEQLSKNDGADYNDAAIFIYNKLTITKSPANTNCRISTISKLVDTLLWWDNMNIDQSLIRREMLINYACLSRIDFINSYLEIAQQRKMDSQTYIEFLNETYKLIKKHGDAMNIDNDKWTNNYISKRSKWQEFLNVPIKKWCKWLLI